MSIKTLEIEMVPSPAARGVMSREPNPKGDDHSKRSALVTTATSRSGGPLSNAMIHVESAKIIEGEPSPRPETLNWRASLIDFGLNG